MAAADGFADVEQCDLPSVATTTAADFVGRLSTVSVYLMLDPRERAEVLRQGSRGAARPGRDRHHGAAVSCSTGLIIRELGAHRNGLPCADATASISVDGSTGSPPYEWT
jgi:hypothetical protein